MPLHKEPLTQALRNVTDERWRAHQNNVIKTPLSRYLAPSGGDLPQQGRFTPITPPSTASRPVTGINSPSSGRIYPGTCRVLELKDGGISGNGGGPPVQQVTGAWKRAIPTAMHGSPYLREDEQPNPRSMTTAVATFTPTGHIKVELKTDGVGLDLATPTKKRILNAATVVDSSSPESPGTPASGHAKRYSAVPSAADLRTPTPRRKKAAKRILSDSECDDSLSFQQAQTPAPPRRSAATTAKTRVDGSLVTITQGFIDLLSASETKSLDINKVAIRLGIPKRRIYDITNALEGIGFLRKGVKNMVHWTGVNADHINPDHQTVDHDVGALKAQQRSLDHLIKSAKDQFDKIVSVEGHRLWVTHEDLVVASKATSEQERLLMPVHAPVGTAIESSNAPEDYRVYLKSTDGPITVTLLSESIVSAQKAEQNPVEDMKPVIAEQHDVKPAELQNMAMPTASSAAMASFAAPSTSATALYSDPSFGAPKIENSGNRDELPSSLLDSPTTNLLRLLDSPIKGFESDWRRPHSGNGIAGQGINSTLANTGTSPSDPVDWIDSLPLELGECDYNFVMDGTEGLGNLFDFF